MFVMLFFEIATKVRRIFARQTVPGSFFLEAVSARQDMRLMTRTKLAEVSGFKNFVARDARIGRFRKRLKQAAMAINEDFSTDLLKPMYLWIEN